MRAVCSSESNFLVWGREVVRERERREREERGVLFPPKITAEAQAGHPLFPPPRHNDCLDKKYVPCRENILHHGRKLEIFDVLGWLLFAGKINTIYGLPTSPGPLLALGNQI